MFFFALVLCSDPIHAAEISIEACASATVTSASAEGALSGFPEECYILSVQTDEEAPFNSKAESASYQFYFGGCNSTGADVSYTMEHNMRYTVTGGADEEHEQRSLRIRYSLSPMTYTDYSGEFNQVNNGVIEDGLCYDFVTMLTLDANAASGLTPYSPFPVYDARGLYYDPDKPGHGFDVNVHEQFQSTEAGLTAYYYGHTADGERLWLISETISPEYRYGDAMELKMFAVPNGVLGDPGDEVVQWGTAKITLYDCKEGFARLNGTDGEIQMNLEKLVTYRDSSCN